jgi:hypothetical protein
MNYQELSDLDLDGVVGGGDDKPAPAPKTEQPKPPPPPPEPRPQNPPITFEGGGEIAVRKSAGAKTEVVGLVLIGIRW